jgi:hypothetical protein
LRKGEHGVDTQLKGGLEEGKHNSGRKALRQSERELEAPPRNDPNEPWPPRILEESSRVNRPSMQKGLLSSAGATEGCGARQRKKPGCPMSHSGTCTITRKRPRTLGHTPIVPSCYQGIHSI